MRARAVHPGVTFEYFMWIFTRISGIGLVTLGLLGMASAFLLGARTQLDLGALMRWTFFPNPNHVVNSNIPDVVPLWANGFWQVMQILIVSFGVTHGFNGLRIVVEDFLGHTILRPFLRGLVGLLWLFTLLIAVYVILNS